MRNTHFVQHCVYNKQVRCHTGTTTPSTLREFVRRDAVTLMQQVRVQLPTYANSVALPAFAVAGRRLYSNRSISLDGRAHSSKPAAAGLPLWAHPGRDRDGQMDRQTDGRTDTVPFRRSYYAGGANDWPGARFTKYLTTYRKIIVSLS